jgi:predicted nuclease with TOPRIM domain
MQIHTPETFNIFYNEATAKLLDHNNKLVVLENIPTRLNLLENENTVLKEKLKFMENRSNLLESRLYELNTLMIKFFAYNKQPKLIVPQPTITKPPEVISFKPLETPNFKF